MDRVLWKEREGALSSAPSQWTFSFLKPESLRQRIAGEVITRLERKGLTLKQLRLHRITPAEAHALYEVHKGKPFLKRVSLSWRNPVQPQLFYRLHRIRPAEAYAL